MRDSKTLSDTLVKQIRDHIMVSRDKIPYHITNRVIATTYLQVIDKYRVQHLDAMQYLRDKVGLMSYAQQDPLVIYKKE